MKKSRKCLFSDMSVLCVVHILWIAKKQTLCSGRSVVVNREDRMEVAGTSDGQYAPTHDSAYIIVQGDS